MSLKNKLEVTKLFDKRNEIINNLFKQEFELLMIQNKTIEEIVGKEAILAFTNDLGVDYKIIEIEN